MSMVFGGGGEKKKKKKKNCINCVEKLISKKKSTVFPSLYFIIDLTQARLQ